MSPDAAAGATCEQCRGHAAVVHIAGHYLCLTCTLSRRLTASGHQERWTRSDCPVCERSVAVEPSAGRLANHLVDPRIPIREGGSFCLGSASLVAHKPGAFDKFSWLTAVQADGELTDRDFRVAAYIGLSCTRPDGLGWPIILTDLASALPGGLSGRRLRDSLRRLCSRGHMTESNRIGGGRGLAASRSFDLALSDD